MPGELHDSRLRALPGRGSQHQPTHKSTIRRKKHHQATRQGHEAIAIKQKKPSLNSLNRDEGLDLLASYNHLSGIRNNFCVTQPDTSQS